MGRGSVAELALFRGEDGGDGVVNFDGGAVETQRIRSAG